MQAIDLKVSPPALADSNVHVQSAQSLEITSDLLQQAAADELGSIKRLRDSIEAKRVEVLRPIDVARKSMQDFFMQHITPLDNAMTIIKSKMAGYIAEQDRRRREEQARLDAEAAEQRRIAREQEAAAEQDRLRAEEEARKAAASGDIVAAAAAQEKAEIAAASIEAAQMTAAVATSSVVVPMTKTKGTSAARPWKARITDKMAVIKYIAEHPEYEHLVEIGQSKIDALAKTMKDKMPISGIETYQDIQISARA